MARAADSIRKSIADEENRARQISERIRKEEKTFRPPRYVSQIAAGGTADYSIGFIPISRQGTRSNYGTIFVYGLYGYDDERGHHHGDKNFCWRYENEQVYSCLQFTPLKEQ